MATSGNRGKFTERLRDIRLGRSKKNTQREIEDSEVIYKNFLKVVAAIPLMVYDSVINNDEEKVSSKGNVTLDNEKQFINKEKIIHEGGKQKEKRPGKGGQMKGHSDQDTVQGKCQTEK